MMTVRVRWCSDMMAWVVFWLSGLESSMLLEHGSVLEQELSNHQMVPFPCSPQNQH